MSDKLRGLKYILDLKIKDADSVFIVGHNGPDFDSIGSCIGLYTLATKFGKKAYIIVDDEPSKIEPGVKKIIDDNIGNYHIINKNDALVLANNNSLLIVADTNKKGLISVGEDLDYFGNVFVIDHHDTGEDTIRRGERFIDTEASSASEIVAALLHAHSIVYDSTVANYLLAGISLDTRRFKQNTTSFTHDVAEHLIDNGADIDYVNDLFLEEFESYCKISNLIINGTIIKKYSDSLLSPIQVSFTLNRNQPNAVYLKEDLAKTADKMMKFSGIDAAFALGFVDDDVIHISARSGKRVNVGKIMEKMYGGGNPQSAAARVTSDNIFQAEQTLMNTVQLGISDDENIYEEPQVIKDTLSESPKIKEIVSKFKNFNLY